jgi:putative intracellular protease/amidase
MTYQGIEKMKAKALVILYPECVEYEIMLAAQLIHEHLPIDVATPEGADLKGASGMVFRATHSYADVHPDEYQVILVPGGDLASAMNNETLDWLLTAAHDAGATFGAICGGPLLLAKAGILKGQRFTHGCRREDPKFSSPYWEGGSFENKMVVVDGNIVTAKPEAHIDFAVELLYAAGLHLSRNYAVEEFVRNSERLANCTEIEAVKAFYKGLA